MANPATEQPNGSGDLALRAELRWAALVLLIVTFLVVMIAYMSLHWATMPAVRVETVDPTTLHLAGEFTEDNLGTVLESDGSATVRVLAQQYSFSPQCLLVPADTPVTFRATSADVIHGFLINQTNVNLMLEPGYVSVFRTTFKQPGEHVMPCHEYCGAGHAGMWTTVRVIDKADFLTRAAGSPRLSCVE
jgi:cytochrome c oxidase subunit 2